jgi:hypothetical protein
MKNPLSSSKIPNKFILGMKLSEHQQALFYTGPKYAKSKTTKINLVAIKLWPIIKMCINIIIVGCALLFTIFKPVYLLAFPILGALVYFKYHFEFYIMVFKVYVTSRNYYKDRRELYKMGSLLPHLRSKKAKYFEKGAVKVWAESVKLQDSKFKTLRNNKQLQDREYIKLIYAADNTTPAPSTRKVNGFPINAKTRK